MSKKWDFMIRHAYLPIVIACVTVLCGSLAVFNLSVAEYPPLTPPQISITVNDPGSDAETLLKSTIEPLEQVINGVDNLIYLQSTASNAGQAVLTATFAIGTDPNMALLLVQNRVEQATSQLPQAVSAEGVIVQKNNSDLLLAALLTGNDVFDSFYMNNYAAIHLIEPLQRIEGVAQASSFGSAEFAMRIWLNPIKMAALGISPETITSALESQNVQVPAGAFGEAPAPAGTMFRIPAALKGRLKTPEEFAAIVLKAQSNGASVRLGDVAKIELEQETYANQSFVNGKPAVSILIFPNADANVLEVSKRCRAFLNEAAKDFPPGMKCSFPYDSSEFVRQSISRVAWTLVVAVFLVAAVTLLFLQSFRMAIVPILAIPVSVIGTFAGLWAFGYQINLLTLFALILAIGIVVDDAIIVMENISRLMETEHLNSTDAAVKSMTEITGAVAATTAVLLAMFIPVCFFSGIAGEMYREFGVTISIAVTLSAINALSLTPALGALILKNYDFSKHKKSLFRRLFSKLEEWYGRFLGKIIGHCAWIILLYLALAGVILWIFVERPQGFVPADDQGVIFCNVRTSSDASLQNTREATRQFSDFLQQQPGVRQVVAIDGYDIFKSVPSANNALVIAVMETWSKRTHLPATPELANRITGEAFIGFPAATVMAFVPPPIPGIGTADGFEMVIRETAGSDTVKLARNLQAMMAGASRLPEVTNVFTTFRAGGTERYYEPDTDKAMILNVAPEAIDAVFADEIGISYVNQFNLFGKVYKVETQSNSRSRALPENWRNYYVLNNLNQPVPLAEVVRETQKFAPELLSRYNLALSASIQGSPAPGSSSGAAIAAMERLADETLEPGMAYAWTGMAYQQTQATVPTWLIFSLAGLFIFLFLSALYESFMLPLAVLPTMFAAMWGAYATLSSSGMTDNLYTRIGLVLLFGMACKTAILLVDFAEQSYRKGIDGAEAARHGASLRFRAVWMTASAFILGTLPLAFASGAGAASSRSIGVPVVGGMLAAVPGVLLIAPLLFVAIRSKQKNMTEKPEATALPTTTTKTLLLLLSASFLFSGGCYQPPAGTEMLDQRTYQGAKDSESATYVASLETLTLDNAEKIALANAPNIHAASRNVRAAVLQYYQALGQFSPQIAVGTSPGQQLFRGGGDSSTIFYTYSLAQASMVFFDGLSREFSLLESMHSQTQKEHLLANERRMLIAGVRTAYDEVRSARKAYLVAVDDYQFQRYQYERAQKEVDAGETARSAILSFEGGMIQAEQKQVAAGEQIDLALFALAEIMGVPAGTISENVILDALPSEYPDIPPVAVALDTALAARPDLEAVRENLTAMRYQYYRTWSSFSPQISGAVVYTYSTGDTQNSGYSASQFGTFSATGGTFSYGATAIWEPFTGFTKYNKMRASKAALDAAYWQGTGSYLSVIQDVRSADRKLRFAVKNLDYATRLATVRKEERDLVAREYEVGETPLVRLVQAQEEYVNSTLQAEMASVNLSKSWAGYRSATGENIEGLSSKEEQE